MSSVFVVVKVGVYRHDLCGYSNTIQGAKDIALKWAHYQADTYHDFDVIEVFDDGPREVVIATWVSSKGVWQ